LRLRNRLLVLTRIELGEVKLAVRRLARPQAKVVGCSCTVAGDRSIVCDCRDVFSVLPHADLLSTLILVFPDVAVELDVDRDVVARELPVEIELADDH
jgi:hypothetical protein